MKDDEIVGFLDKGHIETLIALTQLSIEGKETSEEAIEARVKFNRALEMKQVLNN